MAVDHYENFPVASVLLPRRLRYPVTVIYRFAREADDIADEGNASNETRLLSLADYGAQLDRIARGEPPRTPLFAELTEVVRRHELPIVLFHDLLSAFAQDVTKKHYADHAEVLEYCRRSANPIGRLLLALYNETGAAELAQADCICSALQITNFLQDVAVDFGKGRIYLPGDELARYGVTAEQIAEARVDDAWRELMRFQILRARQMLRDGAPLGRRLRGRIGLEMRMIIAGGNRILDKIDDAGCDVFRRRPVLRSHDWALMYLKTWSM